MGINESLEQVKRALGLAIQEKKKSEEMVKNIGPAVIEALAPVLDRIADNSLITKGELVDALSNIKIEAPKVQVPQATVEVKIPPISVPEPKVTVNVPDIKIPEIKIPKIVVPKPEVTVNVPDFPKIPKLEWPEKPLEIQPIGLKDYNLQNPLPVQLRDANGKPVSLDVTNYISGSGGRNIARIGGVDASAYASMMNSDGRLKVSVETGGSGLTDSELRASHLDTQQLSGSVDSVYVLGAFGSSVVDGVFNADNRIRVSVETGGSGLTDAELRATSVPVEQVSGSNWSVYVSGSSGTVAAQLLNADGTYRGTIPVEGTVAVSGVTNSVAATILNADGTTRDSWTVVVSGAVSSAGAYLLNGDGTYRDTLPISGVVTLSGALTSAVVVGPTVADAADDGNAPIQQGGVARQTNPTAVADNNIVKATFDDLGRQIVRHQVRDLTQSAYAQLTTGTETTLLAGVASTFLDLLWVVGANNSDAAVSVDIRSGTAGSTLLTLQIPANGTAGIAPALPIKQEVLAGTWTADMGDITGTTVSISALFSKEV